MLCDSLACDRCAPNRVRVIRNVLIWAAQHQTRPIAFWRLSLAQPDNRQRAWELNDLRRSLARRGLKVNWTWTTERSEGGHLHIHAVVHGSKVSEQTLGGLWRRDVHVEPVRRTKVRSAMVYMLKGTTHDLAAHRVLNQGKAAHWSRNYLPGTFRETQRLMAEPATWTWHHRRAE